MLEMKSYRPPFDALPSTRYIKCRGTLAKSIGLPAFDPSGPPSPIQPAASPQQQLRGPDGSGESDDSCNRWRWYRFSPHCHT